MMSCIVGAIISACSHSASMQIDGPLATARSYPAAGAWNYAVYAVPLQQMPPIFVVTRRA
jgi:hypothetical protein